MGPALPLRTVLPVLLMSLLLSEAPIDAPKRTGPKLTWKLSIGSFLGSVWAAPAFREVVNAFKEEQILGLESHNSVFDSQYLIYAAPVLGPWMTLARGGQQAQQDMWLLITTGVLQGIGLSTLTYRMLTRRNAPAQQAPHEAGLVLDISPYVAGRLGLSISLTGW